MVFFISQREVNDLVEDSSDDALISTQTIAFGVAALVSLKSKTFLFFQNSSFAMKKTTKTIKKALLEKLSSQNNPPYIAQKLEVFPLYS